MQTSLYIISVVGIILGLGHFYFGYIYHVKRTSFVTTLSLLCGATSLNLLLYFGIATLFPETLATRHFYMVVLFLFVLHHFYDTYRFGFKKQSLLWLMYGMFGIALTYSESKYNILGPLLIWSLVFYHYIFWIYLSAKRFDIQRRRSFLWETAIVYTAVIFIFFVNEAVQNIAVTTIFSIAAFHHLTSIHILFSTLKELRFFKKPTLG